MKKNLMSPGARGGLLRAAALALVLSSGILVQAQVRAPTLDGEPGRSGMSDRDRNLLDRENQLRQLEKHRQRAVKNDPRLAFVQIREDFRHIQIVDYETMRAASSGNGLDYKQIEESMAEIRKCAARLKTNLVFPEAEKEEHRREKSDPDTDGIKPSLAALDTLVLSFVHNPIFKETGVVDAKLGGKAGRDLDSIIELSEKIRKSAERMRKNNMK